MRLAWERLHGRNGHEVGLELLESLYREETGNSLPAIQRTPQGKPYFLQSPLHFSISHSKNHVFCCLCKENVGMDAEEMDRPVAPAVALRFCSEAERLRIQTPGDLLRLWVLKESYAKLTGRGLGNYLLETDFSPMDPRIQIIDGCYVAMITESEELPHAL